MDKRYDPDSEEKIYNLWWTSGVFTPKVPNDPKKARREKEPFVIILPPPNANDPLHAGHVLYVVEDILIRYHRMLGEPTLWLPGTDHAGIETQYVFEKYLQSKGKSRFDFNRNTLFEMISEFVEQNKDTVVSQMKRLGFSLDWTRLKFTLDEDHNRRVCFVFKKMCQEGLIYRSERVVNYCTKCGTVFSNLEVRYTEEKTKLYYLKYGPFILATTRPETKFGDTGVAVNPKDSRYKKWIGKEVEVEGLIGKFRVKVVADPMVDMNFGTGVVKITPAHDPDDYEAGLRHGLPLKKIIDINGRLNESTGRYAGLTVSEAREKVVKDMEERGMLVKIEKDYIHRIGKCYKCNTVIEPLAMPQWFVKIETLAQKGIEAVESDEVKIFPKRFKKNYLVWMKNIRDWPISRQIVWGQRIPAWYRMTENPKILVNFIDKNNNNVSDYGENLKNKYDVEEIRNGLQSVIAPEGAKYYLSAEEAGPEALQETDTFDTWFSSAQWPYSTLGWEPDGKQAKDFDYFYPTTVLDTMWDILFFWVARMIMMGIYVTGKIPFRVAHMHSRVLDGKGKKMSKSKGNVINPIEIVEKYGADALRMALVFGIAPGSDIALSEDKIIAQRNFVNKIWNASRFILMTAKKLGTNDTAIDTGKLSDSDKKILKDKERLVTRVTKNIDSYRFGKASEEIYQFFWHEFCDVYIEESKNRGKEVVAVLLEILLTCLKLLHPFTPFVTETIYQELKNYFNLPEKMAVTTKWPKA